ncbi:MAG: hypothetical protein MPW15_18505 [Candidatus Manganitrophus sp.]|nr:hypothetical protein [Candidatus Manganitrophus sp.]
MEDQRRKGCLRQDLPGTADRLEFGRREENRESGRGGVVERSRHFLRRNVCGRLSPDVEPADLIAALLAARPFLESHHGKAYETLDQYISSDKETQRMARLENIMGAIRNNLPQIPELKDELRRFLDDKER